MNAAPLPPLPDIQAALRKTTEHLARELSSPTAVAPDWTPFEWDIARAVAAMQGISVLLAKRLRWRGPSRWRRFVGDQADQSAARECVIADLITRLDRELREAGATAIALKGTALREYVLYAPGERPMGDVDLLVDVDMLANVDAAIRQLDYVNTFNSRRHAVFEPRIRHPTVGFGEHPSNALKIEVHTTISESLPFKPVDITGLLRLSAPRAGLNRYPSTAALMLHLLLHTAGNMRAHAMRCVQLKDIALLASRMSSADWQILYEAMPGNGSLWWIYPPLAMTEKYFSQSIPSGVLASAELRCPRWLRIASHRWQLTDVSWSNLRIHAFPGVQWSRSPLEAFRFAMSRGFPSHLATEELGMAIEAQPSLNQVPWYALSQSRRVIRWLLRRPPRVQTLVSVRASLGMDAL